LGDSSDGLLAACDESILTIPPFKPKSILATAVVAGSGEAATPSERADSLSCPGTACALGSAAAVAMTCAAGERTSGVAREATDACCADTWATPAVGWVTSVIKPDAFGSTWICNSAVWELLLAFDEAGLVMSPYATQMPCNIVAATSALPNEKAERKRRVPIDGG
jgi:hypothetical protein